MNKIIAFLKRAFPMKKRTIRLGICNGILWVMLYWYPLPMLLEKLDPPRWLLSAVVLLCIFVAIWLILRGKLFAEDLGIAGWAAVGHTGAGAVLAILSPERFGRVLVAGICLLTVYVVLVFVRWRET